jgi:Glucose / Sorbosone dehydrogenase
VFVAEKSGRVLVFASLDDPTPAVFADLSTQVYNFWDRGLLGLALDPAFPERPYVYLGYTHDAEIGGTGPGWGAVGMLSDPCPPEVGATCHGCVVSGRVSRSRPTATR